MAGGGGSGARKASAAGLGLGGGSGEGAGGGEAGRHPVVSRSATLLAQMTGRRQKLPVPKTETEGINLWNLVRTLEAIQRLFRVLRVFLPSPTTRVA